MRCLAVFLTVGLAAAGCGSSSPSDQSTSQPSASPPPPTASTSRPATTAKKPRHTASRSTTCPSAAHALDGVYHPDRLTVLSPCKHAAGSVVLVRHEQDGDLHIDVQLDSAYQDLLAPANDTRQHGDLVVEFMARDGGHLPGLSVGDRISLTGAWVDDTQHSWNELHPVWAVSLNGGAAHTSGPRFGGSPAGDRSYNAAEDCRTQSGARCQGYGVGTASDEGESAPRTRHRSSPGPSASGGSSGGGCEPGYSPCLPRVADLNCRDIPADKKPVRVTGSDPYGLDSDHNGIGCQSG